MKPLSNDRNAARQRREKFYELRRSGLGMVDAAVAAGVADPVSQARYERWYQAIERGEVPVPVKPGRKPGIRRQS
jgi:hypothetical protein